MRKDCIFCQIIKKEVPCDFIYEDKDVVVFNDIEPLTPVHILIIPKKHIKGIQTVEKKDQAILGKMLLIARKMAEKEKLKGYRLLVNCGKLGGQGVFHFHLHLMGGWKSHREFGRILKKRLEEGGVL